MLFNGLNGGTVELLDNVLVIRRKGLGSFLTQGMKGEKRIPYSSITSVQFKEAGFTTGYIQFGIAGGIESRGGVWDATTDENTVLFTKAAADAFRHLRDLVEDRAAEARGQTSTTPSRSASPSGISEELGRLADLRDRGVLTDDEFKDQKARLLGTGAPATNPGHRTTPPTNSDRRRLAAAEPPQVQPPRSMGKMVGISALVLLVLFFLFH